MTLPGVVKRAMEEHGNLRHLHIFLDSGTTITPAFRPLFFRGLAINGASFTIHTNNLAGIDELHKLSQVELETGKLREEDFNLLPGSPLSKYRATTDPYPDKDPAGPMTQFLEGIWQKKGNSHGEQVTIAVVTANWLLVGPALDTVEICSRGRGHLEFKASLIQHADYIILVAPLGKLLRIDAKELNSLIPGEDHFKTYRIPETKGSATYLLTTHRPSKSLSPFRNLTIELQNVHRNQSHRKNYILWEDCQYFDPPGTIREEVLAEECPHAYIRDSFERMYGISPR